MRLLFAWCTLALNLLLGRFEMGSQTAGDFQSSGLKARSHQTNAKAKMILKRKTGERDQRKIFKHQRCFFRRQVDDLMTGTR